MRQGAAWNNTASCQTTNLRGGVPRPGLRVRTEQEMGFPGWNRRAVPPPRAGPQRSSQTQGSSDGGVQRRPLPSPDERSAPPFFFTRTSITFTLQGRVDVASALSNLILMVAATVGPAGHRRSSTSLSQLPPAIGAASDRRGSSKPSTIDNCQCTSSVSLTRCHSLDITRSIRGRREIEPTVPTEDRLPHTPPVNPMSLWIRTARRLPRPVTA